MRCLSTSKYMLMLSSNTMSTVCPMERCLLQLPNVFLRLEGAGPMATDLVFSSSPASSTCTQLAFPVDLPDQLIPDSYSAWLQCDTRTLELPKVGGRARGHASMSPTCRSYISRWWW